MLGLTPQRPKPVSGPPERVHFCRAIERPARVASWSEVVVLAGMIGAAGLVLMPLIYFVQWLGGWSVTVEIGVLGAAVVGFWAVAGVRRRRLARRRGRAAANPPLEGLSQARVVCAGAADDLRACGPLEDLPFEPAIFWASFAQPVRQRTLWIVGGAALLAGFGVSMVLRLVIGARDMTVYPIWITLAVAAGLYAWRWPTYFRVTPGRLEVLRYSAFRRVPAAAREHDLRASRVIVDLPRKLIFIDPPAGEGAEAGSAAPGIAAAEYSFVLVPEGERFAHRVLLAAISKHDAPRLSADELIA